MKSRSIQSPLLHPRQPKNFRSLEETISFLQLINRGDPFASQQIPVNQFVNESRQQPLFTKEADVPFKKFQPVRKMTAMDDQPEGADRKRLNKNRAIKRIMLSSLQILQNAYHKSHQQSTGSSSTTEFQIYLKQYNRLLQRILNLQKERQIKMKQLTEKQENLLEKVYNFTVIQDYKEVLQCAILKNRISKETFQHMMEAFSSALLVLKGNQLKVHAGPDLDSHHRLIKLHEIQNVDYHSDPYYFTVLTIVKDKSKQSEYLYLRFNSAGHQNKWDRAIYCMLAAKKMKHKTKLFQIEYPPQKQQTKINIGTQSHKQSSYDVNKKEIIRKATLQQDYTSRVSNYNNNQPFIRINTNEVPSSIENRALNSSITQELVVPNSNANLQHSLTPRNQRDRSAMMLSNPPKSPHSAHQEHQISANANSQRDKLKSAKSIFSGFLDKNYKQQQSSKSIARSGLFKDKSHSFNDNLLVGSESRRSPNSQNQQRLLLSEVRQRKKSAASIIMETPLESVGDADNRIDGNQIESQVLEYKSASDVRKEPRKLEIQQRFKEGVNMKKQKLFFDKAKLLFLKEGDIEYWDYDQSSQKKSELKHIKVPTITKSVIKENKSLEITHENGKSISLLGDSETLKALVQWIELQKKDLQQKKSKGSQMKIVLTK